jgi:hypothetical protein
MPDCTFQEIERTDGIGLHRCQVCGYERRSRYESCKLHNPCRGTPEEHAARRAAILKGELLPSTSHLTPGEYIRLSVKQRWRDHPDIRPMLAIEAELARLESAGALPGGCPSRLENFVTALLCRPATLSEATP